MVPLGWENRIGFTLHGSTESTETHAHILLHIRESGFTLHGSTESTETKSEIEAKARAIRFTLHGSTESTETASSGSGTTWTDGLHPPRLDREH